MHSGIFRVERIFITQAVSLDFRFSRTKIAFDFSVFKHFLNSMSLYFAL